VLKAQQDFALPTEAGEDAPFQVAIRAPGTSFSVRRTVEANDAHLKVAPSQRLEGLICVQVMAVVVAALLKDARSRHNLRPSFVLSMEEGKNVLTLDAQKLPVAVPCIALRMGAEFVASWKAVTV